MKRILLVAILLQCFVVNQTAKNRRKLEISSYTCVDESKNMILDVCSFKQVTSNRFVFSKRFMLNRTFGKEVDLRIVVQALPQGGKAAVTFVDFRLNLCQVLTQSITQPFVKIIMDEVRRTGNVPYCCPLKRNYLYRMDNFSLSDKILPQYTPYCNFTFNFMTYEKTRLLNSAIVKGAVVP